MGPMNSLMSEIGGDGIVFQFAFDYVDFSDEELEEFESKIPNGWEFDSGNNHDSMLVTVWKQE